MGLALLVLRHGRPHKRRLINGIIRSLKEGGSSLGLLSRRVGRATEEGVEEEEVEVEGGREGGMIGE